MTEEMIWTSCRGCHGGCGIYVHLKDGRIVSIEPDPHCPINRGRFCNPACASEASIELVYHKDRLRYPLRRMGERGEGKWRRIGWDEALDTISDNLKRIRGAYGPEAVALAQGTGRDYAEFLYRFANAFGTPNVATAGYVCYFPRVVSALTVCGGFPVCDYENRPRCIMVWGCNPHVTSPEEYKAPDFLDALPEAQLIVIDPRRTYLANRAKIWLQVRPGTDAALALCFLNVIISESLYDRDFIAKHSKGFEKLAERARHYPPAKVSEITWVKSDLIREAARLFASLKPAVLHWGQAPDGGVNCVSNALAMMHLMALTGNIDVKGGMALLRPPPITRLSEFALHGRLTEEQRRKRIGADLPIADRGAITPPQLLVKAILTAHPYQIKAMLIHGSNPLLTWPNSKKVKEALLKLDFLAVTDLFMTPTAELADIVLPAASWLETEDVGSYWTRPGYVTARRKIVQVGECRSDHEILNELGKRLCDPKDFFSSIEDALNLILKPSGMTWRDFKEKRILMAEKGYRKYLERGFSTPSGKYEFYPEILKEVYVDPLPSYTEPPESPVSRPDLATRYPYILTTGARDPNFFHSERRQLSSMREKSPEPLAEIHPIAAAENEIEDGERVSVETPRGSIALKARVTDIVHPRVISIPHAWWFPEEATPDHGWDEANANILTDDEGPYDPYCGALSLRALLCKVSKAG